MDNIFINSKNSKTSEPHRLLFNLTDKIKLKRSDNYAVLSNLNINYIKNSCKNNKFETSAPTWNEDFALPDGSYYV